MNNNIFSDIDENLKLKFKTFHRENPHIYTKFKEYALRMKNTNRKKYSGWVIINVIRWEYDLNSHGDVFKINNDYIALYVRLLIYHNPEFSDFFEIRKMKSFDRRSSDEERYRVRL